MLTWRSLLSGERWSAKNTFLFGRDLQFLIYNMTEKKDPAETSVDILSGDVEVQGYDAHATKKLLRKLDWHIIPFMSLIYL